MNSGIIFDLDGTLWDSASEVTASWNKGFTKFECTRNKKITAEIVMGQMGRTLEDIFITLLPEINDRELCMEIMRACCSEEEEYLKKYGATLYPDLEKTLKLLAGKYKLFIVSNCQSGYIEAFFEAHKLGCYFTDIECSGNTGKPKCDNICIIIERNKLDKAIYVGDTQGDCDSTDAAGIPFVHAKYGFGNINKKTEVIECIDDLVEVAEKILQ